MRLRMGKNSFWCFVKVFQNEFNFVWNVCENFLYFLMCVEIFNFPWSVPLCDHDLRVIMTVVKAASLTGIFQNM